MSSVTNQAATMFDLLSEQEQLIIIALMQRLLPDDIATQEDILASTKAEEEFLAGETVGLDDIDWN
jgi:hypothetical protein